MTLPSQSGRIYMRRANTFRKKRLPRAPFVLVGVIALGLSAWLVAEAFLFGGDQSSSQSGVPGSGAGARLAAHGRGRPESGNDFDAPGSHKARFEPPNLAAESVLRNDSETTIDIVQPLATSSQVPDPGASQDQSPSSVATSASAEGMGDEEQAFPSKPANVERPEHVAPLPTASSEERTRAEQRLDEAASLIQTDPLESRTRLTLAMQSGALSGAALERAIETGRRLSDILIFSPGIVAGDTFALSHKIASGESLEKIVKSRDLVVDWRFIQRINGIQDVRKIRAGNSLKLVTGPFHAVIDKSDYRLDLYLGDGRDRVYVRSFAVGLGEYNSTPVGMFVVSSRLENPGWVNPRTRQEYLPDDPANPIGEHWLGLEGVEDDTRDFTGYGIHGTVEPQSIGKQASMGCVRMLPDDVAVVYETLMRSVSTVEIRN